MRKTTCVYLILLIVTLFLVSVEGECGNLSENIEKGKAVHLAILSRYKKIDRFYREPFLWGELTGKPLCCISVPEKEWESLDETKKKLLADYVKSLVNKIKANPFKYAKVSPTAPMAAVVRRNIAAMTRDSWGIMVGSITPDGRDMGADRIARSGN